MLDENAKDNRQTAAWISHDLSWLFLPHKSSILLFSNTEIVLFVFQLIYMQGIDMNDMFSDILRESDVESSRKDQTRLDSASESKK